MCQEYPCCRTSDCFESRWCQIGLGECTGTVVAKSDSSASEDTVQLNLEGMKSFDLRIVPSQVLLPEDTLKDAHAPPIYQCNMCRKVYLSANVLAEHKENHKESASVIIGDKDWTCRIESCPSLGKPWPRSHDFVMHIVRVHSSFHKLPRYPSYSVADEDV